MIAVIPARIGSKGIPNKNWTPLNGETPVYRAVRVANALGIRAVITSDMPGIDYVTNVTWLPAFAPLHTDISSMVDVVADVLARVPGPPDEIVLLLQPTQPLREAKHLRAVIALLEDDAQSVATAVETEPYQKLFIRHHDHFHRVRPGYNDIPERRQDCEATYYCDGTCYGFRRGWWMERKAFVSPGITRMLVIPSEESAKLDTPFDWAMAELRLREAQRLQREKMVSEEPSAPR